MARLRRRKNRARSGRQAGGADGGLLVTDDDGEVLHVVPADIASSLRFFLTRLRRSGSPSSGLPRTIALTSALAGEGVTFITRSLAAVMAHDLEREICLVETNWWFEDLDDARRKRDPETIPDPRPGVAEVLAGDATLDDVLVPTSEPNLWVLPAGDAPRSMRPVIASSEAFGDLLAMLAEEYDTVVLDVPPVLNVSEAITIARRADSVALVVRHGVTTERQVAAAVEELGGVELLGLILNRTTTRVPKSLRRFTVLS